MTIPGVGAPVSLGPSQPYPVNPYLSLRSVHHSNKQQMVIANKATSA